MHAASNVWFVFLSQAAGASIVVPCFPVFHELAHRADFGGIFNHPAAFAWSKFG
jgi:hypothetical protein